jgi:hypothetical protein
MSLSKNITPEEKKTLYLEKKQQALIKMVMRQTDYDEEKTKEKLKEHHNNYETVIKEYMGVDIHKKKTINYHSTNQAIYGEIRNMMDNAADNYRKLQEIEKKRQEYLEKMRLYMEAKNKQDTPQDQVITEEKKVDVSNNDVDDNE